MAFDREKRTITNLYAAFSVSLILSFMPMIEAAGLAALMFAGVLVAAYILRARADETSLTCNHATFIIRTIWIASLFAFVTTLIAAGYVIQNFNPAAIHRCVDDVAMNMMDLTGLEQAIRPCLDRFIQDNMRVFINGTLIAAAPVVAYILFRLAKGLPRAMKGHRIGNVRHWF